MRALVYTGCEQLEMREVPGHFPLYKAALAEPLAVSWHAVAMGLARMHPDDDRRCLVIGGGAIGLAAALAWHAMTKGEVVIVEPNATRRDYLNGVCGVTAVSQALGAWPCVLDAVGYAATRATACAHVLPGGVIVHVGLGQDDGGVDVRRLTLQEITFVGTYTYTAQDFRDCAAALFDGRLGPLDWVEQRPLSKGHIAFQDIRAGRVAAPKIILKPV